LKQWVFLRPSIESSFPDAFLNRAIINPEKQEYDMGWIAVQVPAIKLTFEPADAPGNTGECRRVFVSGQLSADNAKTWHEFEKIWIPGLFNDIKTHKNHFRFRIRPPITADRIRLALFGFGFKLETAGIACRLPLDFEDGKELAVREGEDYGDEIFDLDGVSSNAEDIGLKDANELVCRVCGKVTEIHDLIHKYVKTGA
jgi:hypothetical protein